MKLLFKYGPFFLVAVAVLAACKKTPQESIKEIVAKKDTSIFVVEKKAETIDSIKAIYVKRKDTLSIIGVGDIMLGTTFPEDGINYLAPNDGKDLLKPVENILRSADITFGNHEGTLFNGKGIPKKCGDPTKCYAFKSPTRYSKYLKEAGFDIMSIANNHSGDFGPDARTCTINTLKGEGIGVAGTPEQSYDIIEYDGLKFGLAAFAPNTGTCRIEEISEAKKLVLKLDSLCDIVIVSFHGGAEGKNFQHVSNKTEIFYGEDRGNVYQFSHSMIDAGADIIFGHGPHVTRALELYKGRIIAYSLGNFATYGRFNLKGENGIAPILKVFIDREGNFLKGEITPIVQMGEGGPFIDSNNGAVLKIKELTSADFPKTNLSINDSGLITIKK